MLQWIGLGPIGGLTLLGQGREESHRRRRNRIIQNVLERLD